MPESVKPANRQRLVSPRPQPAIVTFLSQYLDMILPQQVSVALLLHKESFSLQQTRDHHRQPQLIKNENNWPQTAQPQMIQR